MSGRSGTAGMSGDDWAGEETRLPSAFELRRSGLSERIVKLLTEPVPDDEPVLNTKARAFARVLVTEGVGSSVINLVTTPRVLGLLIVALSCSHK